MSSRSGLYPAPSPDEVTASADFRGISVSYEGATKYDTDPVTGERVAPPAEVQNLQDRMFDKMRPPYAAKMTPAEETEFAKWATNEQAALDVLDEDIFYQFVNDVAGGTNMRVTDLLTFSPGNNFPSQQAVEQTVSAFVLSKKGGDIDKDLTELEKAHTEARLQLDRLRFKDLRARQDTLNYLIFGAAVGGEGRLQIANDTPFANPDIEVLGISVDPRYAVSLDVSARTVRMTRMRGYLLRLRPESYNVARDRARSEGISPTPSDGKGNIAPICGHPDYIATEETTPLSDKSYIASENVKLIGRRIEALRPDTDRARQLSQTQWALRPEILRRHRQTPTLIYGLNRSVAAARMATPYLKALPSFEPFMQKASDTQARTLFAEVVVCTIRQSRFYTPVRPTFDSNRDRINEDRKAALRALRNYEYKGGIIVERRQAHEGAGRCLTGDSRLYAYGY